MRPYLHRDDKGLFAPGPGVGGRYADHVIAIAASRGLRGGRYLSTACKRCLLYRCGTSGDRVMLFGESFRSFQAHLPSRGSSSSSLYKVAAAGNYTLTDCRGTHRPFLLPANCFLPSYLVKIILIITRSTASTRCPSTHHGVDTSRCDYRRRDRWL